jgi:hypothetical protein
VITGSRKLLVAIVNRYPQLIRAHNRLAQNIAAQSVEGARSSIHHHQPLRGKRAGDELGKRLAQSLAFPIEGGELIEHRPGAEDFARLGHQILNVLSQDYAARCDAGQFSSCETQSF